MTRSILFTLSALLVLGCSSEQKTQHESSSAPSAVEEAQPPKLPGANPNAVKPATPAEPAQPAEAAADAPAEAEPAPIDQTVAPQRVEPAAAAAVDGAKLFAQKCASCHGANAEKSALGKSKVIAGWPVSELMSALAGYKDGTYGGAMKALMQGQVKALDDAQVKALAEHIGGL